jgi:hypothetical protein
MTPSTIVARERPRSAAGRRRTRTVIVGLVAVLAAGTAGGCTGSDAASRPHAAPVGEIPQPTSADLKAAGFEALPLAPDGDRVDIAEPTFSDPTAITNPLFPISDLDSVVFSGEVEGKPFHTETTLLPQTVGSRRSPSTTTHRPTTGRSGTSARISGTSTTRGSSTAPRATGSPVSTVRRR